MRVFCLVIAFLFLCPMRTFAAPVLTLEDLKKSAIKHFPLVLAAEREIARAQAARLSALGEFDIKWKSGASKITDGYYPTDEIFSKLEKPTALWGLNIFGGYRRGQGDFAVYDGKRETTSGGEFQAGFLLPLLRGREIDFARAGLKKADIDIDLANTELELKKIELVRKASKQYWNWVTAGIKVNIVKSLYQIAESRAEALKDRVAHGAIPLFDQKDNMKALLQRKGQLIDAEQKFRKEAIKLSLYLRDEEGVMVIPEVSQVPRVIDLNSDGWPNNKSTLLNKALTKRPEIIIVENQKKSIKLDEQLFNNQLLPEFNIVGKISNDVGSGKESLEKTEVEGGFVLEIPLQVRKAQGKKLEAESKISKLNETLNFIKNSIDNDISQALIALEAAKNQISVVREELGFARELESGERQRFDSGESSILIVNLREIATADTAKKEVEALSHYQKSSADLKAVIGEY